MTIFSLLAGIATGICLSALLGITVTLFGYTWPEDLYWQVVVVCALAWPAAEYSITFLTWVVVKLADTWRYLKPPKKVEVPPPPPALLTPVNISRMVPVNHATGRTYLDLPMQRSPRWAKWQAASDELRLWYLETGSLLVEHTVGRGPRYAFSDAKHRKLMLDEWARHGWATNDNGLRSEMLVTPAELALHLARGGVDWTEADDPPPIRPAPREEVLVSAPVAERSAKA